MFKYNLTFILLIFVSPLIILAGGHDTTFYKKYDDRLIVSYFNSYRKYNIKFSQFYDKAPDIGTNLHYSADANAVAGFEINYDKFGVSFATRATPPGDTSRKGTTNYTNWNFSFGGNRWRLETSLRRYKGFYENYSENYIPDFDSSHKFYQQPNLLNQCVRAKFFYFFNHKKFSYPSSFSCSYRQLKSAFSWIVVSNLYHNYMVTDTSFIPGPLRFYYNRQAFLFRQETTGLSFGGGFSMNIVLFKRLFANITLALNPEIQFAKYAYFPTAKERSVLLNWAADLRGGIGFNGKRFFYTITGKLDMSNFNYNKVIIDNQFGSVDFTIGYRFRMRTPGFYKKFQTTKIYSWL